MVGFAYSYYGWPDPLLWAAAPLVRRAVRWRASQCRQCSEVYYAAAGVAAASVAERCVFDHSVRSLVCARAVQSPSRHPTAVASTRIAFLIASFSRSVSTLPCCCSLATTCSIVTVACSSASGSPVRPWLRPGGQTGGRGAGCPSTAPSATASPLPAPDPSARSRTSRLRACLIRADGSSCATTAGPAGRPSVAAPVAQARPDLRPGRQCQPPSLQPASRGLGGRGAVHPGVPKSRHEGARAVGPRGTTCSCHRCHAPSTSNRARSTRSSRGSAAPEARARRTTKRRSSHRSRSSRPTSPGFARVDCVLAAAARAGVACSRRPSVQCSVHLDRSHGGTAWHDVAQPQAAETPQTRARGTDGRFLALRGTTWHGRGRVFESLIAHHALRAWLGYEGLSDGSELPSSESLVRPALRAWLGCEGLSDGSELPSGESLVRSRGGRSRAGCEVGLWGTS